MAPRNTSAAAPAKKAPAKAQKAAKKASKTAAKAARKAPAAVAVAVAPMIPGAPGVEPPSAAEPTDPRPPLPPKPDQLPIAPVSPTGELLDVPADARAQTAAHLTTAQGVPLRDTDHSLKAGPRGPVLLQDHHLREKITHFDHERIPERVVHARGAGAHGVFRANGAAESVTSAAFLAKGVETPVFTRFSTVVGSRGSADTVRDTRGFATKFKTTEGTFDLVGNNIPVFFIQDGIKFPDIIHAAKPHPDREIPQAQSAHDTFWDFVSLHTEATHHVLWQMSDRAIPRSYRTMEGFGVHTFRLTNAAGETTLVKFHWKPSAGVHSLLWEEAQMIAGTDPDYHRRDLADAIEAGAYPTFDLGIQVLPDTEDQTFEGIDLLDATKLVPEELAEVQVIGTLTLNANPVNYFAATEQVAFHVGNLVPGIDVTDDPLMAGRLFSYIDTQLTRLGGPNFNQLPINRPLAPVNDMFRDGFHQTADHAGVAPYRPNSLDGGCPFVAGADASAFVEVPREVAAAARDRVKPASFDDHFTQARTFWLSLTPVEQQHVVQAFSFELGKCYEQTIKERELQVLANVDADLCASVALALGLPAPDATDAPGEVVVSPALSQVGGAWPTDGRVIGIVADETSDLAAVAAVRDAVDAAGMTPLVIGPHGGQLETPTRRGQKKVPPVIVQRTFLTARSVEFDAVLLAGAPEPGFDAVQPLDAKAVHPAPAGADPRIVMLVAECARHAKAIGGWGEVEGLLAAAGAAGLPGVVTGGEPDVVLGEVVDLLAEHRVWDRFPVVP